MDLHAVYCDNHSLVNDPKMFLWIIFLWISKEDLTSIFYDEEIINSKEAKVFLESNSWLGTKHAFKEELQKISKIGYDLTPLDPTH